ncbi:GntR family transcriptional regulator, partial [Striga asiatica]
LSGEKTSGDPRPPTGLRPSRAPTISGEQNSSRGLTFHGKIRSTPLNFTPLSKYALSTTGLQIPQGDPPQLPLAGVPESHHREFPSPSFHPQPNDNLPEFKARTGERSHARPSSDGPRPLACRASISVWPRLPPSTVIVRRIRALDGSPVQPVLRQLGNLRFPAVVHSSTPSRSFSCVSSSSRPSSNSRGLRRAPVRARLATSNHKR